MFSGLRQFLKSKFHCHAYQPVGKVVERLEPLEGLMVGQHDEVVPSSTHAPADGEALELDRSIIPLCLVDGWHSVRLVQTMTHSLWVTYWICDDTSFLAGVRLKGEVLLPD